MDKVWKQKMHKLNLLMCLSQALQAPHKVCCLKAVYLHLKTRKLLFFREQSKNRALAKPNMLNT